MQLSLIKCSPILRGRRYLVGVVSPVLCLTKSLCCRYRVVVEGERGNRPHIYCLEQLLQEAVCEAKGCLSSLPIPSSGVGKASWKLSPPPAAGMGRVWAELPLVCSLPHGQTPHWQQALVLYSSRETAPSLLQSCFAPCQVWWDGLCLVPGCSVIAFLLP